MIQKIVELPPELVAEVERFAATRELSFKAVVMKALRRHLDHPPPVAPDPPLPVCDPDPAPNPRPAPKKSRKKKS